MDKRRYFYWNDSTTIEMVNKAIKAYKEFGKSLVKVAKIINDNFPQSLANEPDYQYLLRKIRNRERYYRMYSRNKVLNRKRRPGKYNG